VEWWNGGIVEWWNGGIVESWNGGIVELRRRRVAESPFRLGKNLQSFRLLLP
jgi:hypothetical protein